MSDDFHPIFKDVEIGIGTWAWGDRLVWNYGQGYSDSDIEAVFNYAITNGCHFFDTAEVYGQGRSEVFLGKLLKTTATHPIVASKFMPFPWRFNQSALKKALTASLERLQLSSVQLYQIHWPLPLVPIKTWMEAMLDVQHEGMIQAVGVSNYDLRQMLDADRTLREGGSRLVSNQVEYHLLNRQIEKNGLLAKSGELGIKVIAYSPLAMGMLSGKYTPENPPSGTRAGKYSRDYLARIQPLIRTLKKIGMNHDGKTASQVALNWIICKGALPIPGAKNVNQAESNLGATGWHLSQEEVDTLDQISDSVTQKG